MGQEVSRFCQACHEHLRSRPHAYEPLGRRGVQGYSGGFLCLRILYMLHIVRILGGSALLCHYGMPSALGPPFAWSQTGAVSFSERDPERQSSFRNRSHASFRDLRARGRCRVTHANANGCGVSRPMTLTSQQARFTILGLLTGTVTARRSSYGDLPIRGRHELP